MPTLARFGLSVLLVLSGAGIAAAQGSRTESDCADGWPGGNGSAVSVCELRELTLQPAGRLQIDAGPNGAVDIAGWDDDSIRVRALIRSWDRDEAAARERLAEITIETEGEIRARGPNVDNSWRLFGRRNGGWNVSFEIMTPHATDLWIESVNGSITVAAIRGSVDAETVNGGIALTEVTAALRARTVNGGISAELAGRTVDGDMIDVRTTNGGILLRIPEDFSATLDIETVNGGVSSDFPVTREGSRGNEARATLGDGGPLIRARAVNGGVQIGRL